MTRWLVAGRWRQRKEDAGSRETAACAEFQELRPSVVAKSLKIVTSDTVCGGKVSMATKKSTNHRFHGDKSEMNIGLMCICGSNQRFVNADFILLRLLLDLCLWAS